jgi:ribonuclease HI
MMEYARTRLADARENAMTTPASCPRRLDLLCELLPEPRRAQALALKPYAFGNHRDLRIAELAEDAYAAAGAGDLPAAIWCLDQASEIAAPMQAVADANRAHNIVQARSARAKRARGYLADLRDQAYRPANAIQGGLRGRVRAAAPGQVTVATDGSCKTRYLGWGYISSTGHWGCAADILGGDSLAAELRAVGMAIGDIPVPCRIVLDSTDALSFLRSWQAGNVNRMPPAPELTAAMRAGSARQQPLEEIAAMVAGRGYDLVFSHVRGHNGHLLNEAADSLAKIARECRDGKRHGDLAAVHAKAADLVTAFLASQESVGMSDRRSA